MKIFENFNFTSKEEIIQPIKNNEIKIFFRIYQKFVRHNVVNKTLYIIIIIIEYLQLLFELFFNGSDYVKNDTGLTKNISYYTLSILEYLNFQHFLSSDYISFSQYTLIFIVTGVIVISNFIVCIILDDLNKNWMHKHDKLKIVHSVLGLFNYLNLKIFLIPFNYVFFKSFFLRTWFNSNDPTSSVNSLSVSNNSNETTIIIFQVIGVIFICFNFFSVVNASLLYNDIDPINSKICWAQSYCDIELFNLIIKHIVVIMNFMQGNFFFIKVILVLLFSFLKCAFRVMEWYYSWQANKIILTILEFKFLTFNILYPIFQSQMVDSVPFLGVILFSVLMGVFICMKIKDYHESIIFRNVDSFTTEWEYCLLIIELIRIMKRIQNESKSLTDSIFMGFISGHKKYCNNEYCAREVIISLIKENQYEYKNEFESFNLTKNELNVYRKTNLRDNFDILTDQSRMKCQKIIFSIIKCIILKGLSKLKHHRLLSILEAFLYIHIFDNNFHALFQLMKFFKSDVSHREKFFLFMTLSHVSEKMMEECSIKFSNNFNISTVTDYYYYHEEFLKNLIIILINSKSYFGKLVSMKPSALEVLNNTNELGEDIKKLHQNFNKIMFMNPYEINILRIYSFLLDSTYFMKKSASFNINRLKNNIKYFLMNDKFKNNSDSHDSLSAKTALKSFQENSESAVLISSGNLENLGDVLYCNNLITPILGFNKNQIQGFSINNIIPAPISNIHNSLMIEFYKTGKSEKLDKISNVFALSKDGYLVNIEFFLTYLPNMNFGLMFIALLKNSYSSIQKNILNNKTISYKTEDNCIIVLSKEFNIVSFNRYASHALGLPKGMTTTMPLYNINKISNNFHQNLSLLEKGESSVLTFDTTELIELEFPGEHKSNKNIKDNSYKKKLTNIGHSMMDVENFGIREMAAYMYRKEISHINQHYYYLILHNKDVNNDQEFDEENMSKNEIRSIKTMNSISQHDEMKSLNYDINFKKSSQMIKEELLNDTYSPTFTKFANITVLTLFICIMVWVIVAFIIEMTTLQNISTLMTFISVTKSLKNTIMYMVLDSLLLMRSKLVPLSNINYLQPILIKKMEQDSINLNNLQQIFQINSISSSTNFTNVFNQTSVYYELGKNKNLSPLQLNTFLGMNKFSTNFHYFLQYNFSQEVMLDLSSTANINELKIKIDFIYRNYNKNFFKIFDQLDSSTATTLKSTIKDKRNVLMIIFCVSMLFCIIVLIILLMTVYKSESHKEKFLKSLSDIEDFEIEKILLTLNLFIRAIENFNSEENNMQKIIQNLEKNDNFFDDFIKTEYFLNVISDQADAEDLSTKKVVNDLKNTNVEVTLNNEEKSSLLESKDLSNTKKLLLPIKDGFKVNKSDLYEMNTLISGPSPRKGVLTDVNNEQNRKDNKPNGKDNYLLKKFTSDIKIQKRGSVILAQANKEIEILNARAKTMKRKRDKKVVKNSKGELRDRKSYEKYVVNWSNSLLIILFTFLIVLSYFIISIFFLYSYISNITVMIDFSDIFNNRMTLSTNFLINLNFLILFKDQSEYSKSDFSELINRNERLYSSYMKNLQGSLYSELIVKNNLYERSNPCNYLSNINVNYYLIDCNDYNLVNGLSFMILEMNNDLMNEYVLYKNLGDNIDRDKIMFNHPGLLDNMNVETFFLRVFLTDLYTTYRDCFTNEISLIFTYVLLKFSLYIFILFIFLIVFHSVYVPHISDKLNNIKRSGLFLNNDMFEKFI